MKTLSLVILLDTIIIQGVDMPKGKKICPSCEKEHGARKMKCECGHVFCKKLPVKQGSDKVVKQTTHPLGLAFAPIPGVWVFDREHKLPAIHAPGELPSGPLRNQDVYDYCVYNGLGDCLMEYMPPRKIADPNLKKLWKKAHDAMHDAWRYLIDDATTKEAGTPRTSTD